MKDSGFGGGTALSFLMLQFAVSHGDVSLSLLGGGALVCISLNLGQVHPLQAEGLWLI